MKIITFTNRKLFYKIKNNNINCKLITNNKNIKLIIVKQKPLGIASNQIDLYKKILILSITKINPIFID